jgi:glycosyltransferase involved in cell wall biosynthesis
MNSTIRRLVRELYSVDAAIIPPPHSLDPNGPDHALPGIDTPFILCVSRLLPYKNVDAVVEAFRTLSGMRLVVVGTGPELPRIRSLAGPNVTLAGAVTDDQLRWLYRHSSGLVAASYEDYGLTPLEAATFGKPVAVLRAGGFLDTVVEGETGLFFDSPTPGDIRETVRRLLADGWEAQKIVRHAQSFDEHHFVHRLRDLTNECVA